MSQDSDSGADDEIKIAADELIEPRKVSDAGVWWGYGEEDGIVWEESCERLYGLEPGSFEGTHEAWIERVHPDDREKVEEEWWEAMEEERPFQVVYRIIRPDGAIRWIDSRAVIFTNEEDEYERAVGVETDITERLERFQQVQVLDRILRHNLRNDMQVINGYAELIADATSGEIAEYAEEICQESEQLLAKAQKQQTISELLSTEASPEQVDLISLIETITEEMRTEYPDATISLDLPEHACISAIDAIDEAIQEIIRNAIIHNDQETPVVTVSVAGDDDTVRLRVADNGPGIPEMEREIVTGEQEIGPLQHASGLGLWLVSWVVGRSGGTIAFEDNDPRGTVLTIACTRFTE